MRMFFIKSAALLMLASSAALARVDLSIDYGSSNLEAGISTYDGGDGDTSVVTIGGIQCRKNSDPSQDHYFYCRVEDSEIHQGSVRDFFVTVEYYDSGTDYLRVQYNSLLSGKYKNTQSIYKTNTNQWKTYSWHITDAYFENGQNGQSDFRINGSGTFYLNSVRIRNSGKVVANLGSDADYDGLALVYVGGDGVTYNTSRGGLNCRATSGTSGDRYFYFDISEGFAYRGNRDEVYVTMHYYDNGGGYLALQVDSKYSGAFGGAYHTVGYVWRSNTNQWRSYTWKVDGALFSNRQNGGSDFRIAVQNGTMGYLDMAYVRDFGEDERKRVACPRHVDSNGNWDKQPFADMLNNPGQWSVGLSRIDQVKTYGIVVFESSDVELADWMATIQDQGKTFSLEVPAIKSWGNADVTFADVRDFVDRIQAQGGVVADLQMDEPFTAVRQSNLGSYTYAINETARWIQMVRDRYPDLKIGSIEPYPYFSAGDLEWWVRELNNRCAAVGVEGIDYFSADFNWSFDRYFMPGAGSVVSRIRSQNLPVSVIYIPTKSTGRDVDQDFYYSVLNEGNWGESYLGEIDQYVVQSWLEIPYQTIPEASGFSFTRAVKDFFGSSFVH